VENNVGGRKKEAGVMEFAEISVSVFVLWSPALELSVAWSSFSISSRAPVASNMPSLVVLPESQTHCAQQ
jgi:hypothetical protein